MREYTINGRPIWLVNVREISKAVGKCGRTLRRWEDRGFLPESCIRMPKNSWHGETVYKRYYTVEQAKLIVSWINKFELYRDRIEFTDEARDYIFSQWEETVENFNKFSRGEEDGKKINCEENSNEENSNEEESSTE